LTFRSSILPRSIKILSNICREKVSHFFLFFYYLFDTSERIPFYVKVIEASSIFCNPENIRYRQSGVFTQNLKFKYLYKNHRYSCKLLWVLGVAYAIKSYESNLFRKLSLVQNLDFLKMFKIDQKNFVDCMASQKWPNRNLNYRFEQINYQEALRIL
jgi:hypothetical protein